MIKLKTVKVSAVIFTDANGNVTISMGGNDGPIVGAKSEPEAIKLFNEALKVYFAIKNFKVFVDATNANKEDMFDIFSNFGNKPDITFIQAQSAII